MIKLFTFKLFFRSTYHLNSKKEAVKCLIEAPEDRVRFIKDFARAYEAADLTTCEQKDLILN